MEPGYYRFPTIHNDTVAFVCEGDLWSVPASGGVARRLTSNPGQASTPAFSPDGALLAFAGRDEGAAEVYVMDANGGPSRRLTFLGANSWVGGWSPDGETIIFASNAAQPFPRINRLYALLRDGGEPRPLPTGPAMSVSFGPEGAMVIGRNTTDLAQWKRYRGGLAGELWIDLEGDRNWRPLLQFPGNVALPHWVGERIYFVSDHQGIGNLYSCLPTGEDLRRHTHHTDYYVRHLASDGTRIVYHAGAEWEQMYHEAWRLQRDHFWTEDMSGIDWLAIYQRYLPLLRRIATRAEFSDLMWEMQGELGTSHAYEFGGDYPPEPRYDQGFLGADLRYHPETDSYLVERIVEGDVWDEAAGSPLSRAGVNVQPGDRLIAINGRKVGRALAPGELLVNQAAAEVLLTIAGAGGAATRTVAVKTLGDETPARYRAWVEANRRRVHDATDGRVGYVHIPDMMSRGYAEFHRGYLAEVAREALIVDVRFNGGGHVSQLIIEKLARRRLGYSVQRWGQPGPYPADSVLGPIVGITNEQAGSDGDIFSHVFKLLRIGPLIGKRTWGGVIGINARNQLIDGGLTTQPEYSFWFQDVGWRVENYGTDPDIEVDITPQDHIAGHDPQLERAIAEAQWLLAEQPPVLPDFSERPRLAPRALPDV